MYHCPFIRLIYNQCMPVWLNLGNGILQFVFVFFSSFQACWDFVFYHCISCLTITIGRWFGWVLSWLCNFFFFRPRKKDNILYKVCLFFLSMLRCNADKLSCILPRQLMVTMIGWSFRWALGWLKMHFVHAKLSYSSHSSEFLRLLIFWPL